MTWTMLVAWLLVAAPVIAFIGWLLAPVVDRWRYREAVKPRLRAVEREAADELSRLRGDGR